MKKLIFLLVLSVLMIGTVWGQIVAWDFFGNTGNEATVNATTNHSNLTTTTISRGSGLSTISATPPADTFAAANYTVSGTKADAITNNKFMQFSITADSGYKVSSSTLDVYFRRSSTGPNAFAWYYSLDGFTNSVQIGSDISFTSTSKTGVAQTQIVLSSIEDLQNVESSTSITIRLYGWGASSTTGTFAIGRPTGNDLAIGGSVLSSGAIPPVSTPTFNPVGGFYTTAQNVSLSCETESASIHYNTTSSEGPWSDYTAPINVSSATTIWAYATKDGMDDSSVTSATYSFPVEVTNIAALRASATGTTVYKLTDEAVLTFQQTNRNQKYIQDDTAAILIDDATGVITTSYNLYDGITGIVGTIGLYNGMLQFTPTQNPGAATSTGNTVIPEVRTLASLTSADQGKLIKVTNVTLDTTSGSFWATAQSITVTQGETTGTIRTFPATDYSNTAIPSGSVDIVCLVGQYNTTMQISPRFLSDFSTYYDIPEEVVTTVGASVVLITGGPANILPEGVIPPINNSSFTTAQSMVLNLIGAGPWDIVIETAALWGAYHRSGAWSVAENDGGLITFEGITAAKDMNLPIILGDQNPTLPVELSSFTYTINTANLLVLQWVSQSETNLSGYKVYRNSVENLETALLVSPLIDATNSASTANYQFVDEENLVQGAYYYWLQSLDLDGTNSFYGPISVNYVLQGGEAGNPVVPLHTHLKPVYPNPFNPIAFIGYFLTEAAPVKVLIYNARGQIVARWDNAPALEGMNRVEWNGNDLSGSPCGSGIYFVKMLTEGKVYTQKALLVK